MEWCEITVYTTHFGSELVADIFFENGGNGVAIFDNFDVVQLIKEKRNWDYINEELFGDSDIVLVKGFVPTCCADRKMKLINDSLYRLKFSSDFDLGSLEVVKRKIDDEDWINIWKKHYKEIKIGNVVICPVWIFYKNAANEVKVLIDPGLAFGTGE
ncbi:MAG: 50S ribosomal protein L11 methyltransferase, partial [Firmicutes bacterium]|nr:50S ribosomal protein L11 methyltransferase [Bacillota bacterium]